MVMLAQEKSVPGTACHATVLSGQWLRVVVAVAVVGAMRMAWLYWLGILLKWYAVQWAVTGGTTRKKGSCQDDPLKKNTACTATTALMYRWELWFTVKDFLQVEEFLQDNGHVQPMHNPTCL